MIKKTLESIALVLFNIIGVCVGVLLLSPPRTGHPADNHFLGGLVDLVIWVVCLIGGVVLGGGITATLTVIYVLIKNRKKR